MKRYIDGKDLYLGMKKGTEILLKNKDEINALNVFPVPDGDTGSNMSSAMLEACEWLDKVQNNSSIKDVAKALRDGLLMGARGNSGVILSQIFRGFTESIENKKKVSTKDFIDALIKAKEVAYHAVIKPVEGTMLTLIRRLSERADRELKSIDDFNEFMNKLCIISDEVVAETPKYLKKLRDAKVVDAGAKGLAYIIQGIRDVLNGELAGDLKSIEDASPKEIANIVYEDLKFQYCTECVVKLRNPDMTSDEVEVIRAFLEEKGDSIVLVHQGEYLKCHVHSNNPGLVFEKFIESGDLMKVKVENMKVQHQHVLEASAKNYEHVDELLPEPEEVEEYPERNWGIVAVSPGNGISDVLKSIGVNKIVSGGQTMNPSIKDISDAINAVPYSKVVVLPNNPNIILTAQKAGEMSNKQVIVIPTSFVQQGISSLLGFQDEMESADLEAAMKEAMNNVVPVEVTYAVRDSKIGKESIKKGEYLIFVGKELKGHGRDLYKETTNVIQEVLEEGYEVLTVFYGDGAEETKIVDMIKKLKTKYKNLESEVHPGGQKHYPLLISIE